mmetsp:Transcript_23401/g.47011  ORF Transcript_23401/g.47011 Transcript_23401/m.47011 type:complete len:142 (-) Transcript_23401:827-1252(-)
MKMYQRRYDIRKRYVLWVTTVPAMGADISVAGEPIQTKKERWILLVWAFAKEDIIAPRPLPVEHNFNAETRLCTVPVEATNPRSFMMGFMDFLRVRMREKKGFGVPITPPTVSSCHASRVIIVWVASSVHVRRERLGGDLE